MELLRPRGILEMVRTGKVAMVRGTSANGDGQRSHASEAHSAAVAVHAT